MHLIAIALIALMPMVAHGKPDTVKKVFIFEINAEIDPRTSRYVDLALKSAQAKEADMAILKLNTFGGTVDDADKIRRALLEYSKPLYAFIDKNAASAGALIALACDSIYMASGSSIGAATVVSGNDGMPVPEKYQSYMRSLMRSTAEANGRNPKIAEAFVDPDIDLDTAIKKPGKVLTLTTKEALKFGFCEAELNTVEEILSRLNITDYKIENYVISATESIIAFFLNPVVSSLLILVMLGGIWFELQSPGVGFPIIAAIVAAILYFTPYYLNGLASNWEILIFVVGLILLGVEIFVLPGFGVAGVAGIVLVFSGLVLSMLENEFLDFGGVSTTATLYAMSSVLFSFIISIVVVFATGSQLLNMKYFRKIAQAGSKIETLAEDVKKQTHLIGAQGMAQTVLRPSGKVSIENQVYDATADGEFIEKGQAVVVTKIQFGSLWVKAV